MIQIGIEGVILEGDMKGWHIIVQDDKKNTNGYLILQFENNRQGSSIGYDDWVETMADLEAYFNERKWIIAWQI
jgi:hypothetical protein